MTLAAARVFVGVVDGKETAFAPGDPITEAQAQEMGRASKPELTEEVDDAEAAKP